MRDTPGGFSVSNSTAEYLPASQLVQVIDAFSAAYLPAGHNEQVAADADVAPVCPYVPAEQRAPEQVDEEVAAEYVPASQLVQVVEAGVAAYEPPGHGRHVSSAECLPK